MVTILAFNAGKAVVEDATIKITVNNLLHIWPKKTVLLGKTLVINLLKRLEMVFNEESRPISLILIGIQLGHPTLPPVAEPTLRKTPNPALAWKDPSPMKGWMLSSGQHSIWIFGRPGNKIQLPWPCREGKVSRKSSNGPLIRLNVFPSPMTPAAPC